jgi:hypothetical protein
MRTARRIKGWLFVFSGIPDNFHVNIQELFDLPQTYCQPGNFVHTTGLTYIASSSKPSTIYLIISGSFKEKFLHNKPIITRL